MALPSILPGRVPTGLQYERLTTGVLSMQNEISRLQQQVSTGQRLQYLSDDPAAALQAVSLKQVEQRNSSLKAGQTLNQSYLNLSDNALSSVNDSLSRAKTLALSGIGNTATATEKAGMADEVDSLIRNVVNAGNTSLGGRYLFAGSQSGSAPFTIRSDGTVGYSGDDASLQTFADRSTFLANNVTGASAFGAFSPPVSTDINPALTLGTKFGDLRGTTVATQNGIVPDAIQVTVNNGVPVTKTIDLKGAETLQDFKTRIESAFSTGPVTVTVQVNPVAPGGLQIIPSAGTVQASDVGGSQNATELGIAAPAAAVLNGPNLDPKLSLFTPLAALNGGTGIGATVGTGLQIVNAGRTTVVDLSSAITLGDVINKIQTADPNTYARIGSDGRTLEVSTRVSGAHFSIGENGGTNAAGLGIRTFTGATKLSALNQGLGVDVNNTTPLVISRRDGTTTSIDLAGSLNVQDVLTKINAAAPGVLTATLNTTGNGVSIADTSGPGTLTVTDNAVSRGLGVAGSDSAGATGVLQGTDVNPQTATGVLSILNQLSAALRAGNDQQISRLSPLIDAQADQISISRADIGSRQKTLDDIAGRLDDSQVTIKDALGKLTEVDISQSITELLAQQQALQATLQVASKSLQLSILQYI